jgi:hypothetical protein
MISCNGYGLPVTVFEKKISNRMKQFQSNVLSLGMDYNFKQFMLRIFPQQVTSPRSEYLTRHDINPRTGKVRCFVDWNGMRSSQYKMIYNITQTKLRREWTT